MEREERARLKAIEEARFAAESAELAQLVSAQQEALEEWREEARRKEEVSQCVCVRASPLALILQSDIIPQNCGSICGYTHSMNSGVIHTNICTLPCVCAQ